MNTSDSFLLILLGLAFMPRRTEHLPAWRVVLEVALCAALIVTGIVQAVLA